MAEKNYTPLTTIYFLIIFGVISLIDIALGIYNKNAGDFFWGCGNLVLAIILFSHGKCKNAILWKFDKVHKTLYVIIFAIIFCGQLIKRGIF